MKRFRILVSKIVLVALIITNTVAYFPHLSFAAESEDTNTTSAKTVSENIDNENLEETEILVKYKDVTKRSDTKTNLKTNIKLKKCKTIQQYKRSKVDLLEIDEEDDISEVIEELEKDSNVEYAQPNYKLDIMSTPSDAMFDNQWGLKNHGQETEGEAGRSGVDINVTNAWDLTKGSDTVVVGLLDTGVDISHEDLKDNIYVNTGEIAGNGIDDDNNGYIDDVNGWDFVNNDNTVYDDATLDLHGTHVAGVLAAKSNSVGISGTAPNIKVLPLKFINGNWGYTCDVIKAIEYAMKMGVKIMNCSFGGTDNNYFLKDTMENSGILFVCAAGNRAADVSASPVYPACFDIPNVLSVASIDSMGVLSKYSSYGEKIDVAAPGVNILSTTPGNTYDYLTGTSAAVPFVTGIAALLKSYVPDMSIAQIAQRIKDNVVPCNNLKDKVSSGGRVDAYAALTNTKPETDTYTGKGNENSTVPAGQQGGNVDTWYTMDQLAKIKEKLHYGEAGVNPASGNFSATVIDMSVEAPGFQINMSRTYNSRSDKNKAFGRGWTFGFEGSVDGTDVVDVTLPNGSVERFRLDNDNYVAEESRCTFEKNADGTYTLTTQDQYKYTYNTERYLVKMEDRNGNAIHITVDSNGKVTKVTDTVGREYIIHYNTNSLIDSITDPENRKVTYQYDSNNRLIMVTDPNGAIMRYSYDTWGYLSEIQDHNKKTVEKLTYNHAEGENQHKVAQATDSLGDTVKYSYDMTNDKTTATDNNGRVSTYWFDSSFYNIQVQDPEGKSSYSEYFQEGGKNKYGDLKSTTDRNGNKTQYEIDDRGNVTKITNPDGSIQTKEYDKKNNLIKEVDECGKVTQYIYDESGINLLKKVQPINGTYLYAGTNNGFAVTCYEYYIGSESGCSAKSLLKKETILNGEADSATIYTYDADGNIKTMTDAQNNVTSYEYNRIGWKTAEISPKGYRTECTYDQNGQLIKSEMVSSEKVTTQKETQRTVYDLLGRKIQEISPNQYDSTKDNLKTDNYSDNTVGTRYEYYDSGEVKTQTDAVGNKTSYTYDVYGNILTETKPNGAIYRYEYDALDRVTKNYFKDNASVSEVLLYEYSYAVLEDGKTQKTETKYLNSEEKAVTVSIYDYAERLVEQQNPDGTKIQTIYNANGTIEKQVATNGSSTCYKYDGLNRLTEQWTPLEVLNGDTWYTYQKTEYDAAGNKICEKTGKDKVLRFNVPDKFTTKNYTYDKNGKVTRVVDAEGRKSEYQYDKEGNSVKEVIYTDTNSKQITEYTYNYLGKMETQKQHVNAGDLYGNDFDSTEDTIRTITYTYDKNGNQATMITPDEVVTTYEYDALNREISKSQPGLNEQNEKVTITEGTTYNWEDNPITKTDANGNVTTYQYNQKGLLIKVTDPQKGITAYQYDLAGRKTTEVSPNNYNSGKSIDQMNRVEYNYDRMDRVLAKKDIYYDTTAKQWITLYSKAYQYDNSGNVTKELDAIGYNTGTGNTWKEKIATGYGTEYVYNLANQVITVTDPVTKERGLSFTTKYEYDALTRKTSETNGTGVITNYTYDDAGNMLTKSVKKDAESIAQTIQTSEYDLAGRKVSQTDGNGNQTTYEYNAFDQVRKTVNPGDDTIAACIITYQYDVMGNQKKRQDSMGKVNQYTYDNQGRKLSVTEKASDNTQAVTTSIHYDKNGNKCIEIDGNGNITTNTYDKLNQLITKEKTVNGIKKTTTYAYDANGNQTEETDWLGNTNTSIYDPMNRLIEKKDAYTTIQKLEYNQNSAQVKSVDALGNETKYVYDKNNRLIATIDPEGHTTSQSYDDEGNITTKTDGENATTTYQYDELNRLEKVINAKSETTSYTYDRNGNMLTQTDAKGNTITYEYNAADKLTKTIDHGGRLGIKGDYTYLKAKTEKYTYYADGSQKNMTDRNGKVTEYTYDIHGKLTSKAVGDTKITYTYDNNGNKLTMTDRTGTTTRTYDEENRVLTKTVPDFGKTSYIYDQSEGDGLYSETTTDFKGNVTKRIYDKTGRLYQVVADSKTTTYQYNEDGSRKSVTYQGGANETYTYSKDGLVLTQINQKADGSVIDSYSYLYDKAHNQTSKTDAKGMTTYEYDCLNRLDKVTEPSGRTTSYTYDKAGNRLTEVIKTGSVSVATTYTYNEQNRLISTKKQNLDVTVTENYSYDNNGNTLAKTTETVKPVVPEEQGSFFLYKAGTITTKDITYYNYDVWNQLIKTVADDKTITCGYNAEGYRVLKSINGEKTNYLYEGDKVILETDGTGSQTARNVYGINLLTRTSGSDTMNYMYNGHADVTALLKEDGTIAATYYYDEFGNIVDQTGSVNNNITYAGYQYDSETGLYYLNSRMYDPKTARFLQEDTYNGEANDPLSLNLYTYCENNPISYIDPTGQWGEDVHDNLTRKWATEEFNAYLTKDIVVYKTDKNGKKITDKKKTEAAKQEYLDNNPELVAQVDEYVDSLCGGDLYVDQEKNLLSKGDMKWKVLFHGKNSNSFIKDRKTTSAKIIKSKNYEKKGAINTYITKPVKTILVNSNVTTKKEMEKTKLSKKPSSGFFDTKEEAAMFTLGMALHAEQDKYAHITPKHTRHSDDINWDYNKNKGWTDCRKTNKENQRLKDSEDITRTTIRNKLNKYGNILFPMSK